MNRYFAALDQKQFDETTMAGVFVPEGRIRRPNDAVTVGPKEIGESHARSLGRFRATQHLTSGFIVTVAGDHTSATFRANLVAIHMWAEGHGDPSVHPNDNDFAAGGVLTGRVVRTDAGWRIAEIAMKPAWRTGVGFQEMLQSRSQSQRPGCVTAGTNRTAGPGSGSRRSPSSRPGSPPTRRRR
ncbi:MAG: nuclear transport factor 2 family protein [Myxococcaceae bacterium]|nr:nuclear transport factor 2 family protein [Myxococcaceae bacterium]